MTLKRIPIDDNPKLVQLIEDTYNGGWVSETNVHKITIDGNDVKVEIDLTIDGFCGITGTWGITGTFQIELDDIGNSLAKQLREII